MLLAAYEIPTKTKNSTNLTINACIHADLDRRKDSVKVMEILTNDWSREVSSKDKFMKYEEFVNFVNKLQKLPYKFIISSFGKYTDLFFGEIIHLETLLKNTNIIYSKITPNENDLNQWLLEANDSENGDFKYGAELKQLFLFFRNSRLIFAEKSAVAGFKDIKAISVPVDYVDAIGELREKIFSPCSISKGFPVFSKLFDKSIKAAKSYTKKLEHSMHVDFNQYSIL